jgi:hypothetical protein
MRAIRSTSTVVLLTFSSFLYTANVYAASDKHGITAVFCTETPEGQWQMQSFQPLINPRAGTIFAKISFAGNVVEMVRLREFHPDFDVEIKYNFDASGKLTSVLGSVGVWGRWVGESDLILDPNGVVQSSSIRYFRPGSQDRIDRPEGAGRYIRELDKVKIYKTVESLPCADQLQDAEKIHATQE